MPSYTLRFLLATLVSCTQVACTINSVSPVAVIPDVVESDRSIIVYEISVRDEWTAPQFSVELAEYDLKKQNISGNCLFFNRASASTSGRPGSVHVVAFNVPSGWYAHSPFSSGELKEDALAFHASPSAVVYLGRFTYQDHKVEINRDLSMAMPSLEREFPGIGARISRAASVRVSDPMPFLCSP